MNVMCTYICKHRYVCIHSVFKLYQIRSVLPISLAVGFMEQGVTIFRAIFFNMLSNVGSSFVI